MELKEYLICLASRLLDTTACIEDEIQTNVTQNFLVSYMRTISAVVKHSLKMKDPDSNSEYDSGCAQSISSNESENGV